MEIKHILVPYIGTPEDSDLLRAACKLAVSFRAKVSVVHVLEIPVDLPVDVEDGSAAVEVNELLDRAEEIARSVRLKADTVFLQAHDAGHAIVEEAKARKVDLIIMEARQRQRLGMLTFGHITDYVLKYAPMTVWVSRVPCAAPET